MARAKKGTISIDSRNGILRLRLPRTWFNGKLKWFNLSLPDTPENRLIAQAKIGIMQSDYIYERFDFTLEKYRFESAPEQPVLSLVELFTQYLESQPKIKETVFFSEKKKDINLNNFARRNWNDVLKETPVRKRGCYHCRHTFITLCLDNGISIQQVAKWVGNTPQMILKHYAGLLGRSDVPIL